MCTLLIACVPAHPSAHAQTNSRLSKAIQAIADRPEYRHARFGMEVYSLDSHKTIYALNAQQLFVPGSTTKLLTEGTAMKLIGPDFRFKTKIYRIGPVRMERSRETSSS
jgi:D-alanyl-D-alanine carboxypeptidase